MEIKPLDLRTFSLSFNQLFNEKFVKRDNLLGDIEDDLNSECKLVIIEGNDGIGKTNLLLQFANKHRFDSFSYFINTASSFTYTQDYLMQDLGNQLHFYTNPDALEEQVEVVDSVFSLLLSNLLKSAKKNKKLFFILDGLDQIEKSEIELLKSVIKALPWAANNFYFIVSGDSEKLKDILPETAFKKAKTHRVSRFNTEEAYAFFDGIAGSNNKEDIKDINDTWKGNPEWLGQIKRIIEGGISIQEFLKREDLGEKYSLLDIEWEQSGLGKRDFTDSYVKLLCLIAFDDHVRNIYKISEIISANVALLESFAKSTTFLVVKNGEISFVSKSYRKYIASKFKNFESATSSLLIKYFSSQDDLDSVINLPSLFEKNREWTGIINLLSPDNLNLIVSNSKSFSDIKKQINYGYKASSSLKQSYNYLLRFSLYRSTVLGLQKSDTREDQIRAYVALGKNEEAILVMSNAVLKEDRLRMLIEYAKECKLRDKSVEEYIIDEIRELLNDVDLDYQKENIEDLVTGLAHVLPEQAVLLVERVSGLKNDKGSLEWLLGYVAMIINKNSDKDNAESIKLTNTVNDKISSIDFVDKFAKSIAFGINEVSEDEIIGELSKMESDSDKLYMIRRWIKKNKGATNIMDIINYAIELMLRDSYNVKPTVAHLLDIVYPINFFKDFVLVTDLVTRIDELVIAITSPTIEKVKLELLIIKVLFKFDVDRSNERALELYYGYIDNITDYSVRVECMAHFWATIQAIRKADESTIDKFIVDEKDIKKSMVESIDTLLLSTANQFNELSETIRIIAGKDLGFALSIVAKLNTIERRSEGYLLCVKTYALKPIASWDIVDLTYAIELLELDSFYRSAMVAVFQSAFEQKSKAKNHKEKISRLLHLINAVDGSSSKCYILVHAIVLLKSQPDDSGIHGNYSKTVQKLIQSLEIFWGKMDVPWEKVRAGYRIASELAELDQKLAHEYLLKAEQLSEEFLVNNPIHGSALFESIRLMIRAYIGVLENDKTYSYDKLSSMIAKVSTGIEQVALWSELAVKSCIASAKGVAKDVVNKKLLPILDYYKGRDKIYYNFILKTAAPAIHLTQPDFLKLLLEPIAVRDKELIISSVAFVLLTKCDDSDAYEDVDSSNKFEYQDAIDYLNLISMVETDSSLYYHIKNLCHVAKSNPNNFSRVQKIEITSRLTSIINANLPSKSDGIKHIGFVIVSQACLLHFSLIPSSNQLKEYEELAARVSLIHNAADRSYVYSILATECGIKKKKSDYIELSFNEADKIVSVSEKVEIYFTALEACRKISQDIFAVRFQKIKDEVYKLDDSEMFPSFRRLVDIAYKQDKNIAQKLISSLDTDPARRKLTEPASDHLSKLELEKTVLNDYSQFKRIRNRKQMANVAWKMLGQLNAQKRHSRDIDETLAILSSASKVPFLSVIPLFEFFLQNTIRSDSNISKNLLTSFYESTYLNSRLTYNLVCSLVNKASKTLSYNSTESLTTFVAKVGMRDEAFKFIEKYVRESNSKEIYLIDPYFTEEDLWFIKNVAEWCYKANVTVLTSVKAAGEFSQFAFTNAWNIISSEEPSVFFVRVGTQNKDTPIHDRYTG